MSNKPPLNWGRVLSDLHADRLPLQPVREVGRTPGMGSNHTLSAWRGVSGQRYAVVVRRLDAVRPTELLDATVLFVGRDLEGRPRIASGHRDLSLICAERLIEKAQSLGLTEVHLHSGTQGFDARLEVLIDLKVPNLRVAAPVMEAA